MYLDSGDIIFRKNLKFRDNGKLDLKFGGHPTLNILVKEDYTYYLLITSTKIRGREYYPLYTHKRSGLSKESFADLTYVYKEETKAQMVNGFIHEGEMQKLNKKFIKAVDESTRKYTKAQKEDIEVVYEGLNEKIKEEKDKKKERKLKNKQKKAKETEEKLLETIDTMFLDTEEKEGLENAKQ